MYLLNYVILVHLVCSSCLAINSCNVTIEAAVGFTKQVTSPLINYEDIGKEMICWYNIRVKQSIYDLSIRLDFDRFSVGHLDGDSCNNGHLQILDSKHSRVNDELGYYCGTILQPRLIVRQTDFMRLIFTSTNTSTSVEWRFTLRAMKKEELPERFGKLPEYYPGRIGAVVEGTYCETVFQDCREQHCYVQSPGFPGVYPRGINCRYYLSTKTPLIRMYIEGLFWDAFKVDSRRCENFFECDIRQLTDDCPYDYVSIYDGMDEFSPLIGKFCGTGDFPQSIIGTSNKLFLEFVSSRYGPLLNTGFDFRITAFPSAEQHFNSSCNQELQSSQLNGKNEGTIMSLEHWYKPGTNCTYLLKGTETQVVRLYFVKMTMLEKDPIVRTEKPCTEYLALYDSSWTDSNKLMKAFCDGIQDTKETVNYISTGPNLIINFVSEIGSYSGSPLYYWAVFDFHETQTEGNKVEGTLCDETFTSNSGKIHSPKNSLIYLNPTEDVVCSYRISTHAAKHNRISLLLEFTRFNPTKDCSSCTSSSADHLEVLDRGQEHLPGSKHSLCYSACSNLNQSLEVISTGPSLSIKMFIAKSTAMANYFRNKTPIFQARYTFLHPAVCGPTLIKATSPGYIRFPDSQDFTEENVYCIWDLITLNNKDINFKFGNITLKKDDCSEHSILLSSLSHKEHHKECGQTRSKVADLTVPGKESSGVLKLTVKMKTLKAGKFDLSWTY